MELTNGDLLFLLLFGLTCMVIYLGVRMFRYFRERTDEITQKFQLQGAQRLNARTLFMGLRSKGRGQVRGSGVLALTRKRLYFEMLWPKRELVIKLDSVTGLEAPLSFLGKTKFRKLLQVNFTDERGEPAAAAWCLRDRQEWVAAILKLRPDISSAG